MQSSKYLAAVSIIATAASPALAAPVAAKGQDFIRQAALPAWAVAPLRATESEKTDPVVELVSETQIWVGATTATLHNRAVLVNDQSALAGIGQYSFTYVPAYQRLLIHRVAIIRKGQVIDHTASVSIRALEREEGLEKGVYGGAKTMQMLLRDVRIGDTLWVTYTIEGENPVFGGKLHRVDAWDSDIPVEQRRLIVTYPRKRPVGWEQMSDFVTSKLAPRVEEVGENTRLTFEGRELAAVEGEQSTPAEFMPGRILQFSEFTDWNAVAQWASALFESPQSSPRVAALADTLAKGGTQSARATAALRWVQDEVRYFSVSIGENSHRPQLPDVVLRNRYGDCKDKSRLLVALLRQMGIEAKPVLVSAFAPRLPARVKPSPFWFDHVIVRLTADGRDYFVDPTQTGQTEALHELRPAVAGGSGLVVDSATSTLLTIPSENSEVPHFELSERIAVPDFEGAGTLLAKRYYRGDYAAWARRHFSSLSQPLQRKWALELYEKQYPGVTLLEAPSVAEENGRFVMTSRYSLPKPIEHKDHVYKIDYDTRILEGTLDIPAKVARNYPFVPAYGKYHSRYRLVLELPKGLRINNLPIGRQVESPYLQAHEDYISRGNFVDYQLDYRIKDDRIPATGLPALHETSKKLQEFMSSNFRVKDDQVTLPVAAGFSYRDLQLASMWDVMMAQAKDIRGKKEADISLQEACDYSATFYAIQETLAQQGGSEGAALHALLLAKKKEPKAIECVPYSLILGGDIAGALSILEAGSAADDSPLVMEQATARWMAGNLEGAVTDMERYYKAKAAAGKVTGFDTLRLLTLLQRAGRPVPDALLAKAKLNPDGPWPMPLLAMQAGAQDAARVEAIAKAMPADASEMALNDYWLHVGELALVRNDEAAARKAFSWFKANGIRAQIPNMLARAELARLEKPEPQVDAAVRLLDKGAKADGVRALQAAAEQGSALAKYKLAALYQNGTDVRKDPAKAAQLYLAAANQGLVRAYNEIGRCYGIGFGVPVDRKRAVEWYRKGAESGDRIALYNLSTRYRYGDDVERNLATALALLRESAQLGYPDARAELASYYRQGIGIKADYQQARFWAMLASQQEEPSGYFEIGMLRMEGLGMQEDKKIGMDLIRKAADLGYDEAQMMAGFYYEYGRAGKADPESALKYYRMGAEQGHSTAMMRLARMYLYGIGVKEDMALARSWLQKSHAKKERHATHLLAEMMYMGWGSAPDVQGGIDLWTRNAEYWPQSAFSLAAAYHFGSRIPKNPELAVKYYRMAAERDYGPAVNNLGDMYENGLGVEQSYPKAIELYKRAAMTETGSAFWSFSNLFENGLGVQRDLRIAYIYSLLAGKFGNENAAKQRDELAKQLPAGVRKEAEAFAAAWTVKTPLPGLSVASASPAGRE